MLKTQNCIFLPAIFIAIGVSACGGGSSNTAVQPIEQPKMVLPDSDKAVSPKFGLREAFNSLISLPEGTADFDVSGTFGTNQILGNASISTKNYYTGTFPNTTGLAYSKLSIVKISAKTGKDFDVPIERISCFNDWFSTDYLPLGQEQQGGKVGGICPEKQSNNGYLASFLPNDQFIKIESTNGDSPWPSIAISNQSGYIYDSADILTGGSPSDVKSGSVKKPTWEFVKPTSGSSVAQVILKVKQRDMSDKEQLVITTTYSLDSKNTLSIAKWEYMDAAKRFTLTKKQ